VSEINFLHSGGNKVTLTTPTSNPASNITFKLPQADGGSGDILQTDGSGALSFASHSNRNLAINGAMRVAQRGTSTTISSSNNTNVSGVYTVDRMKLDAYVGSERYTLSQETDAPTGSGFTKSFKIKTSTADTSANAGTYAMFKYQIEGQDLQHLLKGTSSAKPLTFSFWVKGNTNYTPVAELKDNTNTRINVQTFNVTSSWTKVTLTYVGDTTGGSIDNDNTAGLSFNVWLKAAAFYSGGTSPAQNTWVPQSNQNIRAALLTFDIGASTDNFFQITGLQIEVGDVASSFEHRSFGDELQRCKRYYQKIVDGSDDADEVIGVAHAWNSVQAEVSLRWDVEMRATPTLKQGVGTNYYRVLINSVNKYTNQWLEYRFTRRSGMLYNTNFTGLGGGNAYRVKLSNANAYLHLDAEL
jgi:hypothetical protein